METLEKRIELIKNYNSKKEIEKIFFTENDEKQLERLKCLGFIKTDQYLKLKSKKNKAYYGEIDSKINNDIEILESNGFKVLSDKFISEFTKKHNLHCDISKKYILDIPLKNLQIINEKIDKFLDILPTLKEICNHRYRKKSKKEICIEFLNIIAPEEHFDKTIPLEDLDPIAVLKVNVKTYIGMSYYIYLDAWNLEKIMFDNDTNNPELLN